MRYSNPERLNDSGRFGSCGGPIPPTPFPTRKGGEQPVPHFLSGRGARGVGLTYNVVYVEDGYKMPTRSLSASSNMPSAATRLSWPTSSGVMSGNRSTSPRKRSTSARCYESLGQYG